VIFCVMLLASLVGPPPTRARGHGAGAYPGQSSAEIRAIGGAVGPLQGGGRRHHRRAEGQMRSEAF
jgi:hypothetical protein